MPIKAVDITPVKKELLSSDPSGDTWVMVRPITWRDDLVRGEQLKNKQTRLEAMAVTKATVVNSYSLRAHELWITYPSKDELSGAKPCHIVVEHPDGSTSEPFGDKEEMGMQGFMQALEQMPPNLVLEWHNKMIEVNPGWAYPF
jgi:hypothetical protein